MPNRLPITLGSAALLMLAGLGTASAEREPAATDPARPKVALVLGGGVAHGVAHFGVLQVLERRQVPIDPFVGRLR